MGLDGDASSRSKSMLSRSWFSISRRGTALVCSKMRSARVVFAVIDVGYNAEIPNFATSISINSVCNPVQPGNIFPKPGSIQVLFQAAGQMQADARAVSTYYTQNHGKEKCPSAGFFRKPMGKVAFSLCKMLEL